MAAPDRRHEHHPLFARRHAARRSSSTSRPAASTSRASSANGKPSDVRVGQRPHRRAGQRHSRAGENTDRGSRSRPATRRSIATPTSSTRCSCRRARTWRFPVFDQPNLKARWSLTLERAGEMAGGQQRRRGSSARIEHGDRVDRALRRNRTALDLPVLVRRRRLQGRDRGTQRPHASACFTARPTPAKVARNKDAIFDLHARAIEFMERYTGIPYAVRQVRLRPDSGLPVRRHGARRQDSLQRAGPAARRIGDAEPVPRAAPPSSRTKPRTCGSAISSRCSGSTTCG